MSTALPEVRGVDAWLASQRELRAQGRRFDSELRAQEASDEAKTIVAQFMQRTAALDPWGTSLTLAVQGTAEKRLRYDAVKLACDVLRTIGWWAYLATGGGADGNDLHFRLEVLNPERELTPEELTRALAKEPEDGEPDPFVLKQLQGWVGLRSPGILPEIEALLANLAIFRVNLRIQAKALEYARPYSSELKLWDSARMRVVELLHANYGDDDVQTILKGAGLNV